MSDRTYRAAATRGLAVALSVACWLVLAVASGVTTGCSAAAVGAGTSVYSQASTWQSAATRLELPREEVYAATIRVVRGLPESSVTRDDRIAASVAATLGSQRLTARATDMGNGVTRLAVFAGAGPDEKTNKDLATSTLEKICGELEVECVLEGT